MRVSFFVLLACLCLSAVSAAKKKEEKKEHGSFVNKDGFNVETDKSTVVTEDTEVKQIKNGDVVEEEEVIKIRTSVNGQRKGKRKKEGVEKPQKACTEILIAEKADCDAQTFGTTKCDFFIQEEKTCAYECRCEQIITEVIEEAVEEESGNGGVEIKKRKVKKAGEKKKKKKVAGGRECAGEKAFSFSNCLIKFKGLAAWGENTANFDAKFDAL